MNLRKFLFPTLCILLVCSSCGPDDEPVFLPIADRDIQEVNSENLAEIQSYLETHFFNYEDFNLTRPDYFFECEEILLSYNDNSAQDGDRNERNFIIQLVNSDLYTLVNFQFPEVTLVRPECGDCTTIANSNEIPEFWEE